MPKAKMVRLLAPKGTDECNFGETSYRVDNDGTVLVPKEAVESLVKEGGFSLADDGADKAADEAPEGYALVMHPDGVGCSWGGRNYEPNDAGAVAVPHAAVNDLKSHGFEAV